MRSPLWFVVAAVMAFGSLFAGGFYVVSRMKEIDRQARPFHVPGSVSIELDKPGTYTIFLETEVPPHSVSTELDKPGTYTIFFESEVPVHSRMSVPGLRLRLIEESSGEPIVLATPPSSTNPYNIAGRFGAPMLSFTIGNAGTYRLTSALESGGVARIAIVRGEIWSMLRVALAAMAITCVGLAVTGIILVLTIWQRSKTSAEVSEA